MLDEDEFFSDFGIRSSVDADYTVFSPDDLLSAYRSLGFRNHIDLSHGGWM